MEYRLTITKIIFLYILENWIYSAFALYSIIGIVLHQFFEIDILIPCLFTTFLNIHCPGCGITHAFIELLSFNFTEAWYYNPLIFAVFPAGVFYVIKDFKSFYDKKNA
ncbi:MAG: hypothetical protein KatS3mg002_1248 [Candidatus Woesearchaeota archaeon]|nr:MAG: hypothetical protein KatS3mg002_1248 [Candidatus Woesearchaeota archaeon]